jgi:hypothetical protein
MRLYLLILATIFQRKAWVLCALASLTIPFALPLLSSATEKPVLLQPARIQAAWGTLWVGSLLWGLFTAAREGENNAKSGIGEYFRTTGITPTRQLFQIWLAVFSFIAPLTLITVLISHFGALPADPQEQSMWLIINLQYATLFLLVIAPLLALAISLASRFGGITGFAATLFLSLYGLYGVGYLDNLLKLEANPFLRAIWTYSPHYRYADLTQRLYFKTGALPTDAFALMVTYFLGILALYSLISRLTFRTRS